jgi:hypothetical protein
MHNACIIYSLEEIRTHCPLAAISLQTLYASIRGFLTWVEVLAVRLPTCNHLAICSWCVCSGRASERVESGGGGAFPFVRLLVSLRGGLVAHRGDVRERQQCREMRGASDNC